MSERKFTVTSGQLVQIKKIEFQANGDFKPVKMYAVVLNDYTCDWTLISGNAKPIKIALEGGKIETVRPMEIEFITGLSEKKIRQITMRISLSI